VTTTAEMVREFHETYDCPIADEPTTGPAELALLRYDLIHEELAEFWRAIGQPIVYGRGDVRRVDEADLVEIADALGDIVYVAYGAALAFGIDLDAVLAEIHRSNMSKLGTDGKPIYRADGKVLKGPNYSPPNLAPIVHKADAS